MPPPLSSYLEDKMDARNAEMQSLQMNDILFYIVFARHSAFTSFLVLEMLRNVKEYYADYEDTIRAVCNLEKLIKEGQLSNGHLVVVFFFFLSMDTRMRHWILDSQQSPEDAEQRDRILKHNIQLVPRGLFSLKKYTPNPFLGQCVAFAPLNPHRAVSILISISKEDFFDPLFVNNNTVTFESKFRELKELVTFA